MSNIPPGWYKRPDTGQTQWWDGTTWIAAVPAMPMRPQKQVGVAYVLLIFLGAFGAHYFYLNKPGFAIAQMVLWWGGWLLSGVIIGFGLLAAVVVWWIVDLVQMREMVAEANA